MDVNDIELSVDVAAMAFIVQAIGEKSNVSSDEMMALVKSMQLVEKIEATTREVNYNPLDVLNHILKKYE